ncbi:MAG: CBS domain-containing protein [Candidatus Diapherotrites archaeon]|nr:CBS domain-containing protein [Candidatus Diapherotrites archaeon]
MRAYDIMTSPVYYVTPNDSIARVRNLFLKHDISSVPVLSEMKPIGMVGEPEIADAFYQAREPIDEFPVSKVMNRNVTSVSPDAIPEDIARELLEKHTKSALVLENEPLGIVTKTNLLDYFVSNYSGKVKVGDIMDRNIRTVRAQHSIFHAIRKMKEEGVNRLVVLDSDIIGVLSMKDVSFASPKVKVAGRQDPAPLALREDIQIQPITVGEVMRDQVYTTTPETDAAKAGRIMLEKHIGSLVVSDGSEIKGMFTKTDIAKYLARS